MPHPLAVLDEIRLNFSPAGLFIMNITLAFIMFGVALEIRIKQFREILRNPKPLILGILSQFLFLPMVTFILVYFIRPTPTVALGMILVASCPGGNISNFISLLAKGNAALSVSLTAFATLAAIFMTPINFSFWGNLYGKASKIIMPIEIDPFTMLQTVFILLGIPLILGIWFSNKYPKTTQRIIKPIKILSIFIFMGFVVAALSSNLNYFFSYIHLIFLIVLVHNALALATGYMIGRTGRLQTRDRRSIAIETGIQNSGLALVLIFNPKLFDGMGGMAFIAAWWGIWHIIAGLLIAGIWSRKRIAEEAGKEELSPNGAKGNVK